MRKFHKALALAAVAAALWPLCLRPCTTFCFKHGGEWIFGRNYDFEIEHGLVVVNKRGLAKTALLMPGTVGRPAEWVSKYGSVTFNQFGRELPLGGMNEAGLVVELMWLTPTEFPTADERPALRELQWVQYQLDTARTVREVVASDAAVRIETGSIPVHFLLCDREGGAAAVEFLGGRMRAYSGERLPARALTNSTYEYCLDFLERSGADETKPEFTRAGNSLRRFVWAVKGARAWDGGAAGDPVGHAFAILDKADLPHSKFRIVYDLKAGRIHFRTRSTPRVRTIDLGGLDLSCATPVKVLDMLADLEGDVTDRFADYTRKANCDLIRKAYSETSFLKDYPEEILKLVAAYPEGLRCKQ